MPIPKESSHKNSRENFFQEVGKTKSLKESYEIIKMCFVRVNEILTQNFLRLYAHFLKMSLAKILIFGEKLTMLMKKGGRHIKRLHTKRFW